jgi:hypothetical protein
MDVIERDSVANELILAPHDVMTANNAPLLLTRTARQHSVVVRYSRVERWDVVGQEPARLTIGARPRQMAWAAFGGVGLGALIVMALAGRPAPSVPAADATVAVPALAAPVSPPVQTAASAPIRIIIARPAAAVAPVVTAVAPAPAAAIERADPDNEATALAQAFARNEAASWRSASATGTVVVGAATIENGRYCRDVAILTRADGAADRTVNSRKCLAPGGRISDQAAPVPQ